MKTTRMNRLLKIYLPVFNDHQIIEGDDCEQLNEEQARENWFFIYWCGLWDDRRQELAELLRENYDAIRN
jgi:hypothetical protein